MLDISKIEALASDPQLKPVVADILDELQTVPPALAVDHLRAAQDAVYHGAWELPPDAAAPLMLALGKTVEAATA
jgi:hypothetical protein